MKALQYHPDKRRLYINEVEIPKPGPSEVLIRIACASLCHSDCLVFVPDFSVTKNVKLPTTIGHEATGYVVETGEEVTALETLVKGDPVGFLASSGCGKCSACTTWSVIGCKDLEAQGFTSHGYFQEYVIVKAQNVVKLPSHLNIASSAPLCCAGVTSFNAIRGCRQHLNEGDWIAIIGAGGVGQLGIQYAKAMGLNAIAIDIELGQLETAISVGADHVFDATTYPKYLDEIREICPGGVHAAVNFTASVEAYENMPPLIRGGGILMAVGIPVEDPSFSMIDVSFGRYTIKGACNGTVEDLKQCVDFSADNGIRPTVVFKQLEEIPDVVEEMKANKVKGRIGVLFTNDG
ncbi:hypothetical protein NW762_008157 [Fusarium torreyae]|uniref:Enoyl reductase (ER) domain-containing protein n=1 Tax=Fusarium torreyae TaxID=1237075 RepID=A0A9W8VFD4_9HYPO|nr:hypothetical protein NW762_008157 [Fusarium torreyae]